jgi:hypothetical protein
MRRILRLVFAWTFLVGGSLGTLAQAPPNNFRQPGIPQPAPPPSPNTGGPSISILGIPTVIRAPVAKPYCNCATQLYGGQPMKSGDLLFTPPPDREQ